MHQPPELSLACSASKGIWLGVKANAGGCPWFRQRHRTEAGKADIAKPLKGFGPGVLEIAVRHRTDAWRVVYVTEMAGRLWVIHAFRKKSKTGIKTPKAELDLIGARLARPGRELKQ